MPEQITELQLPRPPQYQYADNPRTAAPALFDTVVSGYYNDPAYQPSYNFGNYPEGSMLEPTNPGNTVPGLLGAMLPYAGGQIAYHTANRGLMWDYPFKDLPRGVLISPMRPSLEWMEGYTGYGPNPRTPRHAVPPLEGRWDDSTSYDFYNHPYWLWASSRRHQLDELGDPEYRNRVGTHYAFSETPWGEWRDGYTQQAE